LAYGRALPVSTWMSDRLCVGKPSRYVTSHRGQLSLAILLWVGATGVLGEGLYNFYVVPYCIKMFHLQQI